MQRTGFKIPATLDIISIRMDFGNFGKILIFIGLGIIILGGIILLFSRIPFLGKLPGDFHIKREGFSFYFPLTSSIIISIILSIILTIILRFLMRR